MPVLLLLAACAPVEELPAGLMALDGRPAPALELVDRSGKRIALDELRGRWVLVHFWASWGSGCRREMPTLQRMRALIPVEALQLVLVNTAETDEDVSVFLSAVAPELESLLDRDGQVTARWRPRGLPTSFLVAPDGRLRYVALGGRVWDSPEYVRFLRRLSFL